jgi:N-acetylmuramoyl-L-alanine amidase
MRQAAREKTIRGAILPIEKGGWGKGDEVKKLLGLVLLAAALPVSEAQATKILEVRHWSAPDHTRLVIDLSEPAQYRHVAFQDPPRIAIEITGGRWRISTEPVRIDDGLVRGIRYNMLREKNKAQIVIDLEVETRYDVFALEKFEDKPDRIVVDVKRPFDRIVRTDPVPKRDENIIGPDRFGDFVIMVDPGHGGEDAGRRNPGGVKEKDLALAFSRALVNEINRRDGFRAELTRTGDYFVSLAQRRKRAEELGAHLFVSVHFNAAPARSARGTEVFFVSLQGAESRATRELVRVENDADLVGGLPPNDRETTDDLARMIVDLRQHDSVQRSERLATIVTDEVRKLRALPARSVKQAGFAVLKSLFIPAVLIEVGFLTNADDVRYLRSEGNRERYVHALAEGIAAYCEEVEVPRLGWRIHTVNRGETLTAIASTYAMDLDMLRGANGISGTEIRVGQKLRVRPR